jgi:ribulose bisphosphate carboxylase small subunit
MAITVTLTEFNLTDILEQVSELRRQGYQQGVDFDFAYYPEKFENNNSFAGKIQERTLDFVFYDEHLALLFKLGQ